MVTTLTKRKDTDSKSDEKKQQRRCLFDKVDDISGLMPRVCHTTVTETFFTA